jgi:lipopolysaccharide biosynthesis protein
MRPRLIAFYLPQYHPIPENDAWWGRGFTDWTNVTAARPLFRGHYQPQAPGELGYYDLRSPQVRQAQADLAQAHGIDGFCYYHYWFHGKRLLELPFNEVLASGKPKLPFCLCWANQNWTRAWDGQHTQLLIGQSYSEEDDRAHLRWLVTAFRDERYLRIDGKPVFAVYQAGQLPDTRRTTEVWRAEARRAGIDELYLCKMDSFQDDRRPPQSLGFDAAIEFQPDTKRLLAPFERVYWRLAQKLNWRAGALVIDYGRWVDRALQRARPTYPCFPGVAVCWDNSARRKSGAFILNNATPDHYERWLSETLRRFTPASAGENLVFINAWNEWAEGDHLEPCQRWGRGFLEATRRARYAAISDGAAS